MKKSFLLPLALLLAVACSTKTAPNPDKQYEALVNAVYDAFPWKTGPPSSLVSTRAS